jgi:hypothetical protein
VKRVRRDFRRGRAQRLLAGAEAYANHYGGWFGNRANGQRLRDDANLYEI